MVRLLNRVRRPAVALATALSVALGGAAAASAVVGGESAADAAYAFVAKVNFGPVGQMGSRGCSGVLVAPRYVATATACFPLPADGDFSDELPALPSTVTFAATKPAGSPRVVRIIDVDASGDALLAMLAEPVTDIVPPVDVIAQPKAGDAVSVAGYGGTGAEWAASDRPQVAPFRIEQILNYSELEIASAGAALCRGDAGAPVLVNDAGRWRLLGIVTESGMGGCYGVADGNSRARAMLQPGLASGSGLQAAFFADFEEPEKAPFVDTPYSATSTANVVGYCCSLKGPESKIDGTRSAPGSRGSRSLLYSGKDNSATKSFAFNKLFTTTAVPVVKKSVLSYWIYPMSGGSTAGKNSTCVVVDLTFSNGKLLRDSGLTDQYGNSVHPARRCGVVPLDRWTEVKVPIGDFASGLQVTSVNVGYEQAANTGGYRGYVDRISIGYGFFCVVGKVCAF